MNPKPAPRRRPAGPARSKRDAVRPILFLICAVNIAAILVHLWGRVQIDFALRENDRLTETKRRLETEIEGLRKDIEEVTDIEHIGAAAETQGLGITERFDDLIVDFDQSGAKERTPSGGAALASLAAGGMSRRGLPSEGGSHGSASKP
jgi:hypothetical protein